MSTGFKVALFAAVCALAYVSLLIAGIVWRQTVNDDYCRTIPLERMDKQRCGVEDKKDMSP